MPFDRPSLSDLRTQTATDINAALPGVDALLRHSNLGIISQMVAAAVSGLYGYQDWQARNQVPFTSTDEYLEGWAALKRVTRKPATVAIGSATFTGTDGAMIPEGATITRSDGFAYVATEDVTIDDGTATVPFAAIAPGALGNAASGTGLALGIGVAGVTSSGVAAGPITGGADVERDEQLRSRMIAAYASPPQGGAEADYIEWSLGVPGVTRCWIVPSGMGAGSIVLLFMMDDANAAFDGFPQGTNGCATGETRDTPAAGDQLALANAIFAKQPVTALVYAVAPTANTIDLTIAGISGASPTTKSAIAAAVTTALRFEAVPGGITNVSAIESAIGNVAGTAGFVLTEIEASAGSVAPGDAGNITSDAGALPVLGNIAYV